MLQEEEFPVEVMDKKDLYSFKKRQVATLKLAFKYLKVKNILYTSRSVHTEENEMVVKDALGIFLLTKIVMESCGL